MEKVEGRAEYSMLFDEIPDLENKKFLDVGSGGMHILSSDLTATISYLREEQGLRPISNKKRGEITRKNHISVDTNF